MHAGAILPKAGFWGTAAALLVMPLAGSAAEGVAAVSAALGAAGVARGGFSVNHMDIAPHYAGVFMGLSNTAGTLAGPILFLVINLQASRCSMLLCSPLPAVVLHVAAKSALQTLPAPPEQLVFTCLQHRSSEQHSFASSEDAWQPALQGWWAWQ